MNIFQSGWYLMYTKPRHEKKVHAQLSEMKIDSFLPTQKKLRNWHDRKKYIDEPVFPSYVFIYLSDMQTYYSGMETEGALYYVRIGKDIARVSQTVIDSIRILMGRAKDLEVSASRFEPGRRLVISEGPLAGLACEAVEYNSRQRLLVRVDLLQRNLLVTLPEQILLPA